MATMQAAEQTRIQQAASPTPRPTSGGRPSRSPSCSTVSSGSTNSLATPTNWKPEPLSTKDKQLSMERMMMNQQSQQQQMMQHQQAQMQLYMKNIAYAQHQFNMQQEHMVNYWNAPPPPTIVHTPTSQIQRAKTIDKHIKATVLQSDVPHYQEYSRARPKARVIPSPASVFAKSRQKAEEDEDDDKPLAYLQDGSAQKLPTIVKSQSSPNLSARKGPVPNVKCLPPAKRPAQKPHRRSPLAEYNTVAQPDDSAQDNGKNFIK